MVTEIVVTDALSVEMISAGQALIRELDKAGFAVSSALWLYLDEADRWRFLVANPEVGVSGPRRAYKQVLAVRGKMPLEDRIDLNDISVIDSKDPLISSLKTKLATLPNGSRGTRFMRTVINNTFIDDAYIYRLS